MLSWHKQAICRSLPLAVFYGANQQAPMSVPEINRAKAVCRACPVRRLCLAEGLGEEWGIWGGYTRAERERGRKILGTWIEDAAGLTIIAAGDDAVLTAYDSGLLEELVVLE